MLVLTADPGEKATHWSVCAIMPDMSVMYIDWGSLISERDLISAAFLTTLRYYIAGTTDFIVPQVGYIDTGWATEECYDICEKSGGFFWPVKGNDAAVAGEVGDVDGGHHAGWLCQRKPEARAIWLARRASFPQSGQWS